jgi:hypothetical protein
MKVVGVLFSMLCLLASCQKNHEHSGKMPLVEVDGHFLYQEDLAQAQPSGLSKDDSVLFAENYIRNWVEDILLYEKASRNIPDNEKIDQLVEHYRRALIMHSYQQNLIEQRLSKQITEEEIKDFYEKNKNLFLLDKPLIKGLFIKVPLTEKGVSNVRVWYKKNTPENVEKLEKFSLKGAVDYSYFYDRWMSASDVIDKIPLAVPEPENYLDKHRQIEVKDEHFWYFLNVEEYLGAGQEKPLDFAHTEIKEILMNLKQVDFMRKVKADLYKNASDKNEITYYYLNTDE